MFFNVCIHIYVKGKTHVFFVFFQFLLVLCGYLYNLIHMFLLDIIYLFIYFLY